MALESKTHRTDSASMGKVVTVAPSWNFDCLEVVAVLGVVVEVAGASYLVVAAALRQADHHPYWCTYPCAGDSGAPGQGGNNPNISGIISSSSYRLIL